MRVSVIIPTFNRRAVLERTLPTVLDQTFPPDQYEVIVVVDGSTDGTLAALRSMISRVRLRVLEQNNRGQAAARNAGLLVAEGELVLFLDDDIFCAHTLVAEHVAAHISRDYLVFGPVLVASQSPETLATKWVRSCTDNWLARMSREGVGWPIDYNVDANCSVRRDVLLAIGGFDERFFRVRENIELGLRLWDAGVRFQFCKMAVTYQLYSKSTDELVLHDAPLYGENEVLLCRKHPQYRRHSAIANYARGPWLKRKIRNCCVHLTLSVDPILKMIEWTTRANPTLGIRVLNMRQALSAYRSTVKAAGGRKQFEAEYAKILPVLLYHGVGPVEPGAYPELTIDPGKFEQQVSWLQRNGYRTIRTGDWLAWCLEGKSLPPKPVLLTFDDAYADLVDYAFPVLQAHGFTADVFVVTGQVGGHNSWDQKDGSPRLPCMSADQIRYWAGQGMEFGAHSRSHADLTTLSAAALEEEVTGSGRDLASILGTMPLSFAYPYGGYNETVRRCVAKTFQLAVTCDEGLNGLWTEPLLVHRTMVQPGDSLLDFALRVGFGYSLLERLRARVRLRSRLRTPKGS
jgi:glycosyltransferase involved in cell wall biosynthesis/peptidoglycan/xylan/chitin deacetylase (PgdA/CDA1 family)